MPELIVEIHVPLTPADVEEGEYRFPWIDTVMEYLEDLDGTHGELHDDAEELDDDYVFSVSGAPEAELVGLARRVAELPGVPTGVYALVTDADAGLGEGRRVDVE